MADDAPHTLTYEPQLLRPGLIAYESPQGVVVRLQARPLWQDVCRATVAALIAVGFCTVLVKMTFTASGAKWGTRGWLYLACYSAVAVIVALNSVQRVRRRLRGDPTLDTVFLHAADHPINPITVVELTRGPLGVNLRRPIKLRVKERSGRWIELPAHGSLADVERTAAELRRALRIPSVAPGNAANA